MSRRENKFIGLMLGLLALITLSKPKTYPGIALLREIENRGICFPCFANMLGIPEDQLHEIIEGEKPSREIKKRLKRVLGFDWNWQAQNARDD